MLIVRKWAAILALALPLISIHAQPTVEWTSVVGGWGNDYAYDLALTPGGQLYLVGDFEQEVVGNYERPTKVLYKFDLDGTLIASQDSRGESIHAVAVDAQGNYYLTGDIWQPATLGVGRYQDFYLAKYSAAGTLLWERTAGTPTFAATNWTMGLSVALDSAGHVFVAGRSSGPAVFGNVTFPAGVAGPFLGKYDADGTMLWAKRVETDGQASSIALDVNGNVLMTGFLANGTADFGGKTVTITPPYGYSFVAKYTSSGEIQWAKQSHGGQAVVTDNRGNIYCAGTSSQDIDGSGVYGMYCAKLTPDGNVVWERIVPGAYGWDLTLDGQDEPILAAELVGTAQLDEFQVQSSSDFDANILICKADATGKFRWALAGGGTEFDRAKAVACNRVGNIFTAGVIRRDSGMLGSAPLDPLYPGETRMDAFLARLHDTNSLIPELRIAVTQIGPMLSWPVWATNFVLEATTSLPAVSWTTVTNTPTVTATDRSVQLPLTGPTQFFRLRQP